MTELIDELDICYKSRYPIIWIQTAEEVRALKMIEELAEKRTAKIITWTVTRGLVEGSNTSRDTQALDIALAQVMGYNDKENRFVVMLDIHNHLTDNVVIRSLKELAIKLPQKTRTSIIVVSPSDKIPPDLQKIITVLEMPLPTRAELKSIITGTLDSWTERAKSDSGTRSLLEQIETPVRQKLDALVQAGMGLTTTEFANISTRTLLGKTIDPALILGEKKQVIRKSGMLEYIDSNITCADVGGLDAFKEWLTFAASTLDPAAAAYGLNPLRGVMLVGPPGTGKTLLAKLVANKFGVPLFLLDMANVTTKFYGESTSNVKRTLLLADTMAPDVMLWDEVEKMFATGGAGEGHEETMRTLSVLLTHIEESKAPVFRVATCNNPMNLKPELLQRFPKIFFVDLPSILERREIFNIHLTASKQIPKQFDVGRLADVTEGYVGREIRNIIQDAMTRSFYEKRPLETEDMLRVINQTTPMAKQAKINKEIQEVREWAADNAINASTYVRPKSGEDARDVIT